MGNRSWKGEEMVKRGIKEINKRTQHRTTTQLLVVHTGHEEQRRLCPGVQTATQIPQDPQKHSSVHDDGSVDHGLVTVLLRREG